MSDTPKPHLSIDSHVVVQLGAELISDAEQALLELVKNAYDADAKTCRIIIDPDYAISKSHTSWSHFKAKLAQDANSSAPNEPIKVGRIKVADNGVGIPPEAVDSGWLMISASNKRATGGAKKTTTLGRIPVGDKGLGRLATMRLGDVLRMRTMTEGEGKTRIISFAWSDFRTGRKLEEVDVVSKDGDPLSDGRKQGTDVQILGLNEAEYWSNPNSAKTVLSKLSLLINPYRRFSNFNVKVKVGTETYDLLELGAEALNFASARVEAVWAGGKLKLTFFAAAPLFRGLRGDERKKEYEKFFDKKNLPDVIAFFKSQKQFANLKFQSAIKGTRWLFSIEETLAWDDMPKDLQSGGAVDPGPFEAEINSFTFNDETIGLLRTAKINVAMLQSMATIAVFRDGFRVRMDDDWLNLASGATSGNWYQLRPKNVVGFFALSNEHNPGLTEKSDREAFIDNPSWRGLLLLAERIKKFANDKLQDSQTVYRAYRDHKLGSQENSEAGRRPTNAGLEDQEGKARQALGAARDRTAAISIALNQSKKTLAQLSKGGKLGDKAAPEIASLSEQISAAESGLLNFQSALSDFEKSTLPTYDAARRLLFDRETLEEHNLRLLDAASVGLSARALVHELTNYTGQIEKGLGQIARLNRNLKDSVLATAHKTIAGALSELRKVAATIDPLLPGARQVKETFSVEDLIREHIELRRPRLDMAKVSVEFSGTSELRIRFSKTRFIQVIENLLQNSVYWIAEHSETRDSVVPKIFIDFESEGLTWWDGALGIRTQVEDTLFDAYVTDKPTTKGQGLGLYIVTAYLNAEGCAIELLPERNRHRRRYKFQVNLSGAEKV